MFYPRAFRVEYGDDLTAVFERQLDELGARRSWLRALRDLAVSIPVQQLESRRTKPESLRVFVLSLALAFGATIMSAVIGVGVYAVVPLLIAGVSLGVAVTARGGLRPAVASEPSASWKKFLVGGSLLLGVLIGLMNIPANKDQDLSPAMWSLLMLTLLLSLTLIGAGVVLAAIRLRHNRRH
jgi:hypothetical protein